jgi:hypothetical protein
MTVCQTWKVDESGITRESTQDSIVSLTGNECPIIYHVIVRPSYWDLQPVEGKWVSISLERVANPARDIEVAAIQNLYGGPVRYALLPETNRGRAPSKIFRAIAEYHLVFSNWTTSIFHLPEVPLPSRIPAYHFALYETIVVTTSPEPVQP